MTLFYIHGATIDLRFLPKDESKHAVRVLRLSEGNEIAISNGIGSIFTGRITVPNQSKCEIELLEEEKHPSKKFRIHMAVAPTKLNDRFEWMLEKMTEIGVDEITPIICDRSERKVLKIERMERIIVSAVKQSWKAHQPIIHPPVKFSDFVANSTFDQKFIAHCNGGCGNDTHIKNQAVQNKNYGVLIGPEGDFTENEVALATEHGWIKTGLGSARLRTETAGLVACFALNLVHE